jgi:predicted Zn-dependent protease
MLQLPRRLAVVLALLAPLAVPPGAMAQDWAAIGPEAWREILKQKPASPDAFLNHEAGLVVLQLMEKAAIDPASWQIGILEDKEPNAFVLPGGRLGISAGAFQLLENQDQLSMIIAHELAHYILHHVEARMQRAAAAEPAGPNREVALMARLNLEQVVPYTAEEEAAADAFALELLAKSAFDPREAVALLDHLGEVENDLLYTKVHPHPAARAEVLAKMVPGLMLVFRDAIHRQ